MLPGTSSDHCRSGPNGLKAVFLQGVLRTGPEATGILLDQSVTQRFRDGHWRSDENAKAFFEERGSLSKPFAGELPGIHSWINRRCGPRRSNAGRYVVK